MIQDALFLTGMQRSGTTLLEKLLAGQPQVSLLSQPFPLLFVEAKQAFLESLGSNDPYPLGHLFLESRHRAEALDEFLGNWRTSPARLTEIFDVMATYSGQYTRFTRESLADAFTHVSAAEDFAALVNGLTHRLAQHSEVRWFGSKETVCEEFVPHLLGRGYRCVIILRDPRDVVASLNHGRGREFGGEVKPTLFNIRQWRKSVAFVLAMTEHPRFAWCRYEDLVANPRSELKRVAEHIGVDSVGTGRISGEIRDARGDVWSGNSSHGEHHGVSMASSGIHRDVLPPAVARAIEAACLPELQLLGYETTMSRSEAIHVLERFRDPYPLVRRGMERDQSGAESLALEMERLERVTNPPNDDSPHWFLFERAHIGLRTTFRP